MQIIGVLYSSHNLKQLPNHSIFCDYVTSGANMSMCAAIDENIAAAKRANLLASN
jgi:hypothetical protein